MAKIIRNASVDPHDCRGHLACEPRSIGAPPHDVCYCLPGICPCRCSACRSVNETVPAPAAPKDDPVARPRHYTRGTIEVWDFIIDQGLSYCLGTAMKYICRAGHKDPAKHVEDLQKAKAYLDREIKRLQIAHMGVPLETRAP